MLVKNRKGFTLIELLIVVVIIGILAAIAIPKFAATKDKAKLASVKTDLRNLMTAQEAYFSDNNAYAASTTDLTTTLFDVSVGNEVTAMAADASSWSATITNSSISTGDNNCSVDTKPPATGEIDCAGATTP